MQIQAGLGSALYVFGGAKNDENAFSRAQQKTAFAVPTTTQSFAIHVDPQPSVAQSKPDATVQELNPALTTLSRPALTDVFVANRPADGEFYSYLKAQWKPAGIKNFHSCTLKIFPL